MTEQGPEFTIFYGRIHLKTSKGTLNAEVTPDWIKIGPLSDDIWDESFTYLTALPVTTPSIAEPGMSERTLREYQARRADDPLFALIADNFGANREAIALANTLKRNYIHTPEELLRRSEDELKHTHGIGRGLRLKKLLELRTLISQKTQEEPS